MLLTPKHLGNILLKHEQQHGAWLQENLFSWNLENVYLYCKVVFFFDLVILKGIGCKGKADYYVDTHHHFCLLKTGDQAGNTKDGWKVRVKVMYL